MKTIFSTPFGWAIVIVGVLLIAIIIRLFVWWLRRKGNLELHSSTTSSPLQTGISEPQNPYSTSPPSIPKQIPKPFDYQAEWWKELSRWYREQNGWKCEECHIFLNSDRYYLHTHHICGTRHNNPQHLKALCIRCHAEQRGRKHRRLRKTEDYKRFVEKYGRQ